MARRRTTPRWPRPPGEDWVCLSATKSLRVPCETLNFKLSGGNIYAAGGVAMADSIVGGNRHVSGKVSFTPKAGGEYIVTGVTGKDRTAVWIVDSKSGKVVSPVVEK